MVTVISLLDRYLVTAIPSSSLRNFVTVISLEARNLPTTSSRNFVTEMSFSSRKEVSELLLDELLSMNFVTVVSFDLYSKNFVTVISLEVARFFAEF